MENITPLSFSCMAQFSSSLLTPPPLTLNLTFLLLLFSFLPLLLLSLALAPLYRTIMESFGRIRLTLPGCLCVELSDFGKEERGLRFSA